MKTLMNSDPLDGGLPAPFARSCVVTHWPHARDIYSRASSMPGKGRWEQSQPSRPPEGSEGIGGENGSMRR